MLSSRFEKVGGLQIGRILFTSIGGNLGYIKRSGGDACPVGEFDEFALLKQIYAPEGTELQVAAGVQE
ncbi:hypothetical protein BH24ACT22_BH24ACT22_19610 [soil metagenome]